MSVLLIGKWFFVDL